MQLCFIGHCFAHVLSNCTATEGISAYRAQHRVGCFVFHVVFTCGMSVLLLWRGSLDETIVFDVCNCPPVQVKVVRGVRRGGGGGGEGSCTQYTCCKMQPSPKKN